MPGAVPGLSQSGAVAVTRVLEEWEVPLKYRRAPITEEEIEFINVSSVIPISSKILRAYQYINISIFIYTPIYTQTSV